MSQAKLKPPIIRKAPAVRHAEVIDAALRVAARVGAQGLVRDAIAAEAGISSSLLHRYFGCMDRLRETVIQAAFDRADIDVIYKSICIEDFKRLNTSPALAQQLAEFIRIT